MYRESLEKGVMTVSWTQSVCGLSYVTPQQRPLKFSPLYTVAYIEIEQKN